MKNITFERTIDNGKTTHTIRTLDGSLVPAFEAFSSLLNKLPFNTRISYSRNFAKWVDYLIEAAGELPVTRRLLFDCLAAYGDYLTLGAHSANQIARRVATTLPSPMVSSSSCGTMIAPVRRFFSFAEMLARQEQEFASLGIDFSPSEVIALGPTDFKSRLSSFERRSLKANSLLAGLISGGAIYKTALIIPRSSTGIGTEAPKYFPFRYCLALLESMTTWRDKTLYSLVAACGCRISEAIQLLWTDINVSTKTIRLVDPTRRVNDKSYLSLKAEERDRLVWKGRTTQATLLIEPFASYFFSSLREYLNDEYWPHGRHEFVFQYTDPHTEARGKPYFLSSKSSQTGAFSLAVAKSVPKEANKGYGAHSLRHLYGTYLLNYFPTEKGYGLPIGLVKQLMGHRYVKDTEKYAIHDLDLLRIEVESQSLALAHGQDISPQQFRLDALRAKADYIENLILEQQ